MLRTAVNGTFRPSYMPATRLRSPLRNADTAAKDSIARMSEFTARAGSVPRSSCSVRPVFSGIWYFGDTVVAPEMVLAALFSLTVVSAGFATLRMLGLAKGAVALGLTPPAGLAVLAIVSSWCMLLGLPPLLTGALVFALAAAGLGLALYD